MSDTEKKSSGKNWFAIIIGVLAFLGAKAAIKHFMADPEETPSKDFSSKIITDEELGINLGAEPIKIDLLDEGQIIVDGKPVNPDEIQTLVLQWKKSRRPLSLYSQDDLKSPASMKVMRSGIPLLIRTAPQISE